MEQWPPLHGLLCSYTYMYIYLIKLHYISVHDTQHPIKWGGGGYILIRTARHGQNAWEIAVNYVI